MAPISSRRSRSGPRTTEAKLVSAVPVAYGPAFVGVAIARDVDGHRHAAARRARAGALAASGMSGRVGGVGQHDLPVVGAARLRRRQQLARSARGRSRTPATPRRRTARAARGSPAATSRTWLSEKQLPPASFGSSIDVTSARSAARLSLHVVADDPVAARVEVDRLRVVRVDDLLRAAGSRRCRRGRGRTRGCARRRCRCRPRRGCRCRSRAGRCRSPRSWRCCCRTRCCRRSSMPCCGGFSSSGAAVGHDADAVVAPDRVARRTGRRPRSCPSSRCRSTPRSSR